MLKMYKMLSMENIKEKTIVCIAQQLIIAQQMSWGVTHPTGPQGNNSICRKNEISWSVVRLQQ